MMRGVSTWALAVKKPDGTVEVTSEPVVSWAKRHRVLRLPVIRGFVALVESLKLGFRAMRIAANSQITDEDEIEEIGGLAWTLTVDWRPASGDRPLLRDPGRRHEPHQGLARTPRFSSGWSKGCFARPSSSATSSRSRRIGQVDRLFKFHGAEHKTISAFEAGDDLTPERAALYSRHHPRCGTSFLLLLVVLAVFVFAPLGLPAWYWLVASRVLGIPLVAGIAYEIIKWAGQAPRAGVGASDHVARSEAPGPDHARARSRAPRGRDHVASGRACRSRTRPSSPSATGSRSRPRARRAGEHRPRVRRPSPGSGPTTSVR